MTRPRFALPPSPLARLALIMLALGAAHGVFVFARLFVSPLFAAILAAAFEATYIGLATWQTASEEERVRAQRISRGAAGVSISYNAIAAFLSRNPEALSGLSGWGYWTTEALLAILFGAPLALVAYLLAGLLLHHGATESTSGATESTSGATESTSGELAALLEEQRATSKRELAAMRSLVEELRGEVALLPATGAATEATSGAQCEDCGREFANARALGGHRSRCPARQNGHAGVAR